MLPLLYTLSVVAVPELKLLDVYNPSNNYAPEMFFDINVQFPSNTYGE